MGFELDGEVDLRRSVCASLSGLGNAAPWLRRLSSLRHGVRGGRRLDLAEADRAADGRCSHIGGQRTGCQRNVVRVEISIGCVRYDCREENEVTINLSLDLLCEGRRKILV